MKNPSRFWNWFQDNHHTFKSILRQDASSQKNTMYWIKKNLGYYCDELSFFLIIPQIEKDKYEIVLTSTGDTKHFLYLFTLLDNAPPLRSWKFTAMMANQEQVNQTLSNINKPYILRDITLQNTDDSFISLHKGECPADASIIITLKRHTVICSFDQLDQTIYSIVNNSLAGSIDPTNLKLVQLPATRDSQSQQVYLSELSHYVEKIPKKYGVVLSASSVRF